MTLKHLEPGFGVMILLPGTERTGVAYRLESNRFEVAKIQRFVAVRPPTMPRPESLFGYSMVEFPAGWYGICGETSIEVFAGFASRSEAEAFLSDNHPASAEGAD